MTTQQYKYQTAAFDGGYFAQFKPHYHITDYQGNVVGVCNYAGRLEQRADYYPYGELHREPTVIGPAASGATVNPFFYTGMERQTANGLSELAYPARQYAYKVPFFTTTDPKAEDYHPLSPYIMCGADPINNVDPTGEKFTDEAEAAARLLINESIKQLSTNLEAYRTVIYEIYEMRQSEQVFDVINDDSLGDYGTTTYDLNSGSVIFSYATGADLAVIAHEFKHGHQFITGDLDLSIYNDIDEFGKTRKSIPIVYDKYDELDAFNRGALFGGDKFTLLDIDVAITGSDKRRGKPQYRYLPKERLNVYTAPSIYKPRTDDDASYEDLRFKDIKKRRRVIQVNGKTYK